MADKVILSFSGGLDTSVAVKWLAQTYGLKVVTLAAGVGGKDDLQGLKERALSIGAEKAIVIDARREFIDHFIFPSLKANALCWPQLSAAPPSAESICEPCDDVLVPELPELLWQSLFNSSMVYLPISALPSVGQPIFIFSCCACAGATPKINPNAIAPNARAKAAVALALIAFCLRNISNPHT